MAGKPRKGILNYTTTIDPMRTAGEISGLLAAKGARSVSIDYNQGEPVALSFSIEAYGKLFAFRLPCNVEGYEKAMTRNSHIPRQYKTTAQAKRTAWRNLKEWVEVQLAFIETNQAEMTQVFLSYVITDSGQTLFQRLTQDSRGLLAASDQRMLGDGQ
jgi:hypothetical protein